MTTIQSLLQQWDGESTVIRHDRPSGAFIIIAIHSSHLGIPSGGTRMKMYPDLAQALQDAHRLAQGMTLKFAVAGMKRGGGKAVIALPPDFDPGGRPNLLRRYGALIKSLNGAFETGPDVGTAAEDMDLIAETGAPHVFCRTPANGGSGDTGPATALGVFHGMHAVCERLFGDPALAGRRVLLQGVGSVGRALIDLLREAEAEVLFNDIDRGVVDALRDVPGIRFVPAEAVYETPCDIFAPCALGGVLNQDTIPKLRCRAVAGGANNQLAEPADARRLHARGILYAPDYAINIGGAMVAVSMELDGLSRAEAEERVKSVRGTLLHIFEVAGQEGCTSEEAARRIAEARLSRP